MTRALLLASALAVLPFLSSADARPVRSGAAIDVAAVPAYPGGETAKVTRRASRAASARVERLRADRRARTASSGSLRASYGESGSGVVRSKKTGATARVSPRYAAKFQAYIDDLEARGAAVYYMGGYRKGPCWIGGLHPCGKALDVCQDSRDRVSGLKNCRLPGRSELARIAAAHGLFEGGQWCNGDMGHVQVGETAAPCRSTLYSAVRKFKKQKMAVAR